MKMTFYLNTCSWCGDDLPLDCASGFCSEDHRRLAAREMQADLAHEVDTPPTDEEMESNDARSPY